MHDFIQSVVHASNLLRHMTLATVLLLQVPVLMHLHRFATIAIIIIAAGSSYVWHFTFSFVLLLVFAVLMRAHSH